MSGSKPLSDLNLDELRLALSIAEGPSLKVNGTKLLGAGSYPFKRLRDTGLLVRKDRATMIICQECHRRHWATLDFDRTRQTTTYFCNEAGRVTVEPEALDVYELDLDYLLHWAVRALRIAGNQRPIPRIKQHLWELGEATIEGQRIRAFYARRIGSAQILERLEQRLLQLAGTGKTGVVLTASPGFDAPHRLRCAFSIVDISEVVDVAGTRILIDCQRLLQIVEPEATVDRYRTGSPGRPSAKDLILEQLAARIKAGVASLDRRDEAADLKAWLADHHPDARQPTIKTVLNNIAEPHRAYRTSMMLRPK